MSRRFLFGLLRIFGWISLGGVSSLLLSYVLYLENRPDLEIWHTTDLDTEFTEEQTINRFDEYLAIEARVFQQLEDDIVKQVESGPGQIINRFSTGSASDPGKWTPNWNRSFELSHSAPRAGVLLLHGMSDSPYSLRKLGEQLNKSGAWVLGLRLPGHGTAPSGLTSLSWQDLAAAVGLAMQHLQANVNQQPLYIVGYSAGGALAVHYALDTLDSENQARADGLVLISPAIGVSSLARLAVWQARLGHLLGMDKLQWSDIKLEYDPFKYNSFAVNAGDQVYRLTSTIATMLSKRRTNGHLSDFPPVLAFQSGVDATVSTAALVEGLFARLDPGGHELVLFDINRNEPVDLLMRHDPKHAFGHLFESGIFPFTLTTLTNRTDESPYIRRLTKIAGQAEIISEDLDLHWPDEVYSLSHIALPFDREDELYGDLSDSSNLQLGGLALRGERGLIRIPPADMLRLRWNPFYPLMRERIETFMQLSTDS